MTRAKITKRHTSGPNTVTTGISASLSKQKYLKYVAPRKTLSQMQVWCITEGIAAVLAYLHHGLLKENDTFTLKSMWRALLHRDIKPANSECSMLDT